MPEISFDALLVGLPPEPPSVLAEIQAQVANSGQKVVVLDDDPTGTQTVHGVSVLTEWSIPSLQQALESGESAFYILTNSRSLLPEAAQALNLAIGENLKQACRLSGKSVAVISRSDSTLRGHFPGEVDALATALGEPLDGLILAPYFREGGRYTIGDTHYVVSGGLAQPAGETEFARDPAFGYSASYLPAWVQEKTGGRIAAEQVQSISINELRRGEALPRLLALRDQQVCVLNAACDADIEQAALALLEAERQGKRFIYRTAASFVRARAGITPHPLLTPGELSNTENTGGLVVAGSFVPKTSAQLAVLRQAFSFCDIELDVPSLLDDKQRPGLLAQACKTINDALNAGQDVLLYTSRTLITGLDAAGSLAIGRLVSGSLVDCVRGLTTRPRYLVSKGGITSSDVAVKGLAVRKARVMGQVLPGIPVWRLGAESRFPGMVYVVFPGNVGDEQALASVIGKFREDQPGCCSS